MLAAIALLSSAPNVWAAINCTIAPAGTINVPYVPANAADTVTQSSFRLTCTATNPGSAGAQTLQVGANLISGGGPVQNVYRTSPSGGCSATIWGTTAGTNSIPVAMTLINGSPVTSTPQPFWNCVTAGQNSFAANTYSSSVTLSAVTGGPATNWALTSAAALNISVTTPASCSISTAPGNITLTYTSGGSAPSSSTNFAANCTTNLPYTVAVTPTGGILVGVAYTLALSAASGTGTGSAITYTITANAIAGQGGDCTPGGTVIVTAAGCKDTLPHTLTITY